MRSPFASLHGDDTAATEALVMEDAKPESPPMRFGAIPLPFPERKDPSCFTILEKKGEDGACDYEIWVTGVIGDNPADHTLSYDIVSLLDAAKTGTTVTFYISSPGGVVTIALRICAAMKRSKAHVRTAAVGRCCSSGLQLWSCGRERAMAPGSYLMAHGSSHGDSGNSVGIAKAAVQTADFVGNVMLRPLLDDGVLTAEEFSDIMERRADVYLNAETVAARLSQRVEEIPE